MCPDWLRGSCFSAACTLRHILNGNDDGRSEVPCYYDTQSNGCLKPNCPFFHTKKPVSQSLQVGVPAQFVPAIESQKLCVPVSTRPELKPAPLPDVVQQSELPSASSQPVNHFNNNQITNNAVVSVLQQPSIVPQSTLRVMPPTQVKLNFIPRSLFCYLFIYLFIYC